MTNGMFFRGQSVDWLFMLLQRVVKLHLVRYIAILLQTWTGINNDKLAEILP